jgi:hypothetical protein
MVTMLAHLDLHFFNGIVRPRAWAARNINTNYSSVVATLYLCRVLRSISEPGLPRHITNRIVESANWALDFSSLLMELMALTSMHLIPYLRAPGNNAVTGRAFNEVDDRHDIDMAFIRTGVSTTTPCKD